jgi:hypothetical protein
MRAFAISMILACLGASAAAAEPYEFLSCNFRAGKTMADLDAWLPTFAAANDQYKDGYKAVVMTPVYAEAPNTPDFFWMGTWPDFEKLGLGQRNWFEKGVGSKAIAALDAIADCTSATSLWLGRTVYQQK